ncbi:phosphotransferase [Streptomyces luteogriseus]|uniref:phosphotransferase n=1 Tax=Streptomyces luteogriseus TaxID=68233 RepID=UPI003820D9F1
MHIPGPRLDARIRTSEQPSKLIEAAGRALATMHSAAPPAGLHDEAAFEHPPWGPVTLETHLGFSAAQRKILAALHGDRDLRSRGRLVRDRLREPVSPCHGDARTANFCVRDSSLPVLIDWEAAGWGNPAGDMAALCGALLADLLVSTATSDTMPPRASLAAAVERWTTAVRAALAGYRQVDGNDPWTDDLLGAAVGSALLVRAFVRAAYTVYDRPVACLYEVGASLLRAPERWKTIDVRK